MSRAYDAKQAAMLMAVKKNKCTGCKKYYDLDSFYRISGTMKFHSKECEIEYATKPKNIKILAENGRRIKRSAEKKAYRSNDLTTRKEAAKRACHAYIRKRDKNRDCICCGKPLGSDYQAGHFWESGNYPVIRYDEDNIHGQRLYCNKFKGGDSGFYRENLIKRIGIERVERLDRLRHEKVKRTAQDYIEIEQYYKNKLQCLKQSSENNQMSEDSIICMPGSGEPVPTDPPTQPGDDDSEK